MVHDDGGHCPWFRQPQIDGDAAAAVLTGGERAPTRDAAAVRTKMEAECPVSPGIDPGRVRYAYPLVFEIMGREHAVASAHRAVAGGGGFGRPFK